MALHWLHFNKLISLNRLKKKLSLENCKQELSASLWTLLILYHTDYCHINLFKTAAPSQARHQGRRVVSRTFQVSLLACVVCGYLVSHVPDDLMSVSRVILVAILTASQHLTALPHGLKLCLVCAQHISSACQVCICST